MKTKTLLFSILSMLFVLATIQLQAQTTKSICEITGNTINGDHVTTYGNVYNVSGDDFWITENGCSIKCDLQDGLQGPSVGMNVTVVGRVEVDDKKLDETEIDVNYWAQHGTQPPNPPTPTVFTTADAQIATEGTVALLTGSVTSWTDPNDGEGVFQDATGTINIDFPEGSSPNLGENIDVLGTVDDEDNGKEIDVYSWVETGGTQPPTSEIIYTMSELASAPDGSIALVMGAVTSWTNQTDGEGIFTDLTGSGQVDFESDISLPTLIEPVTILGIVDTESTAKEIEIHYWTNELVSVEELELLNISIYPNPVISHVNIEAGNNADKVAILDVSGRLMIEQEIHGNTRIDMSQLSSGIYFIAVFNQNKFVGTSKLMVK